VNRLKGFIELGKKEKKKKKSKKFLLLSVYE